MDGNSANPIEERGAYTGWIVGALMIVAIVAVMAGIWFHYHG